LDGDLKERHAATALSTFLLFTTVNQMQTNSPFEKLNKNKTMFLLDLSLSKKNKNYVLFRLLFCVAFFNTKPISNQMVRDLGLSLTKHLVC
jgi:hypothetical protein